MPSFIEWFGMERTLKITQFQLWPASIEEGLQPSDISVASLQQVQILITLGALEWDAILQVSIS